MVRDILKLTIHWMVLSGVTRIKIKSHGQGSRFSSRSLGVYSVSYVSCSRLWLVWPISDDLAGDMPLFPNVKLTIRLHAQPGADRLFIKTAVCVYVCVLEKNEKTGSICWGGNVGGVK